MSSMGASRFRLERYDVKRMPRGARPSRKSRGANLNSRRRSRTPEGGLAAPAAPARRAVTKSSTSTRPRREPLRGGGGIAVVPKHVDLHAVRLQDVGSTPTASTTSIA
jgi:hypothetical protein